MLRRRHRERCVVRCERGRVVGDREALEPAAVIAGFERRPRQDLVLDRRAELPVGRTHAPAFEDGRVDRRCGERLTERERLPRTALAVGNRIHEVALRDVVAIDAEPAAIVPCAVGRLCETRRTSRVHQRVAVLVVRALQILADVDLQRGLAVAKDVVRRARAGRDVVEPRHADGLRERHRRCSEQVGSGRALPIRRPAPGTVVPDRALQRQTVHRPLILHVERVVLAPVGGVEITKSHGQLIRHAAKEPVVQARGVVVVHAVGAVVRGHVPDLHALRTGDIGRRSPPRRRVLHVVEVPVEPAIDEVGRHAPGRAVGKRSALGPCSCT